MSIIDAIILINLLVKKEGENKRKRGYLLVSLVGLGSIQVSTMVFSNHMDYLKSKSLLDLLNTSI